MVGLVAQMTDGDLSNAFSAGKTSFGRPNGPTEAPLGRAELELEFCFFPPFVFFCAVIFLIGANRVSE